ncbi:MAG: DUF2227 family putative metal-binding protein [Anaerolineae bacterium]|nr:DUF2227 family putative metal-binding protein [Anaerolineae bacterium]
MASGKAHATASLLLTLPAGLLAFGLGGDFSAAVACATGSLAGLILSPDLDVPQRTHSNYIMYELLGRIGGGLWFAFWWPYSRMIPHRSPLSHWPILGTLGRLLYIIVLSAPLWYGFTWFWFGAGSNLPTPNPVVTTWLGWAILGLILSDILHFVMDNMPAFRQHRRPWWQRMMRRIF